MPKSGGGMRGPSIAVDAGRAVSWDMRELEGRLRLTIPSVADDPFEYELGNELRHWVDQDSRSFHNVRGARRGGFPSLAVVGRDRRRGSSASRRRRDANVLFT